MRVRVAWSLAFVGVSVAIACSSGGTSTLGNTGASGSSSGGSGDCSPEGSTAGDGEGYVQKEGCPSCHGTNLAGSSTPLVSGQEPGLVVQAGHLLYPPNLTPDPTTGLGNWTSDDIYYAITQGVNNITGQDLCPEMGQHYPNMCPDEAHGIVAYLQSIPAVVNQVPQSCCPPAKGTAPCVAATSTPDGG